MYFSDTLWHDFTMFLDSDILFYLKKKKLATDEQGCLNQTNCSTFNPSVCCMLLSKVMIHGYRIVWVFCLGNLSWKFKPSLVNQN